MVVLLSLLDEHLGEVHLCTFLTYKFHFVVTRFLSSFDRIALQTNKQTKSPENEAKTSCRAC
jgi:hypothetical protein